MAIAKITTGGGWAPLLNSSARFNSVTSAATVCLRGSPHLKTCKPLHNWKPLGPMTTVWLAFDSFVVYKHKESKASHTVVIGPDGFQLCSCLQVLRCGLPCRPTVAALVSELKRADEFIGESIYPQWRSSLQPWSIEGVGLRDFNGHERGLYSGRMWGSRRHRLTRRGTS